MRTDELLRSIEVARSKYERTRSAADWERMWDLQCEYRRGRVVTADTRGYPVLPVRVVGDLPASSTRSSWSRTSVVWPTAITMSPSMMHSIRSLSAPGGEDLEDGAFLAGDAQPHDGMLEVKEVMARAALSDRSRTRLYLDVERARAQEATLPPGWVAIGDVHTHGVHSGQPSPADLAAWQASLIDLERSWWVGLIVTEEYTGRSFGWQPQVHAYVVHREGDGVAHRKVDIKTGGW